MIRLLLLALLGTPSTLVSQDGAACSFDTLAHTQIDLVLLGLAPVVREDQSREERTDYLRAALALRAYFQRPAMVRLPFAARVVERHPTETIRGFAPYGLHGFVRFRLDTSGRLANDEITVVSMSPDIVASTIGAIQRADSAHAFPQPSKSLRREDGEVLLRFVDTTDIKDPSVALLRVIVPTITVDSSPVVLRFKQLQYPDRLRARRLTGRVLLQFVVRTDSVIEPTSLLLLQAPYGEFAAEAIDGVKSARFRPAAIGSCLVPALVRLPVDFKIRGSPFRSVPEQ